ncbi:MAG: ParB/RepB/Spo0J family partition protein [Sphingomonas sp.]
MELKHIAIERLSVSRANMRGGRKGADIMSILPSVRARGVLVPLIVRANGSPETYEIVAGRRRYEAACAVASEAGEIDPLPCAVIEAGDDAAALEASLIENIARLDPDEVTQWETFTRLIREGRSAADIALTFGLTDLQVRRTLALGNLLPRIRSLYRRSEIDAATVRHLTLANKVQQRDWLTLLDDPTIYCPTGQSLKAWLFGGDTIPVSAALFDLAAFDGEIVSDLFGDERYFASSEAFWAAQQAAIEAKVADYRDAGWEVAVLDRGAPFHRWEHEHCAKRKGGRVYVEIGRRGAVVFHEGFVTLKEARKQAAGETVKKPVRPEITSAMQDYVDLHRHAAVRARLADAPGVALRAAVAHMIVGSSFWSLRIEPQRAGKDAITESVENSASEAAFDEKRRSVLELLGFDAEAPTVVHGNDYDTGLPELFVRLSTLDDAQVLDILAIVMGETLDARSSITDLIGEQLSVDMAAVWQPDAAFLDGLRDRAVLLAMVREIGGDVVADGNADAKAKVLRGILVDHIDGTNGREKVEGWVPRWMAFPASVYTDRGGVGSVVRTEEVATLTKLGETFSAPQAANDDDQIIEPEAAS